MVQYNISIQGGVDIVAIWTKGRNQLSSGETGRSFGQWELGLYGEREI